MLGHGDLLTVALEFGSGMPLCGTSSSPAAELPLALAAQEIPGPPNRDPDSRSGPNPDVLFGGGVQPGHRELEHGEGQQHVRESGDFPIGTQGTGHFGNRGIP